MSDSTSGPPDIPIPGEIWTCTMHPEVREREPGICPHCGMPLVPAQGGDIPDA